MESVLSFKPLAIVCPVLNCLAYTRQFLDTIKSKTPYNIIVINNASNDGTREFLENKAKEIPLLAINLDKNIGVDPAWNLGIETAISQYAAKYILIPNNDILLRPDTIDTLIHFIDADKLGMITAKNAAPLVDNPQNLYTLDIPQKLEMTDDPDFSCFMLTAKAYRKVGKFDEKFFPAYFEDNDYHYRMKLLGIKVKKCNQALYYHFGSMTIKEGAAIRVQSDVNYLKNKEYYLKKWGGYPGNEIYEKPAEADKC